MNENNVVNVATLLGLMVVLVNYSYSHLGICINDESVNLTSIVRKYPSEKTLKDSSTIPLYFGLMVASSEDSDYLNTTVTAVQLALDEVNGNPNLLKGYTLFYTLTTSQCSGNDLADKTLTQLFGMPGVCKLGLIEAGCTESEASLVRAYWVNEFNIPQVTCSSTVQDPTDDLNMFKVSPTNDVIVPALVDLITHYKWTKMALIVETKQEYSHEITKALESLNVTLTVTSLSVENHTLKVDNNYCENNLFDLGTRIFLILVSSETAKHFFCEAFKFGIKYPKYEFIFVSSHDSDWWVASPQDDMHYGCSSEQRTQVLKYSLAFHWRLSYSNDMHEHFKEHLVQDSFSGYNAWYCYDAVYTLALALNKTIADSEFEDDMHCIYKNRPFASQFRENIKQTSFNGKTGKISFGVNGARTSQEIEVFIRQYQTVNDKSRMKNEAYLKLNVVGSFKSDNFTIMESSNLWPRGIPYDGSPVHVLVTVSVPLVVVYYTMATVGIILSIACCVFNFTFRKTKIVRLTSPNLNYLIITGAIFFYISTYWYCLPSVNPTVTLTACCLQPWFLGIGYFLMIGTIAAKLWRIYYIFRNPDSVKKKAITDWHLLVFILLLVLVVAVILTVYVIVESGSPGYELSRIPNADHPTEYVGDVGIDTHYEFYTCSRVPNARTAFTSVVFGLVGILLVGALFMAIKTRKVHIKGLNDAKYIIAIVYVSSIGSIIHIILNFTLRTRVDTFPAALTGSFMLLMTVTLGLVFVPKMINLYQDPDGNRIFSNKDTQLQVVPISHVHTLGVSSGNCIQGKQLQTKVEDLEKHLSGNNNQLSECNGLNICGKD